MRKSKTTWGIVLIIIGLIGSIPATLIIYSCIKSMMNEMETNSVGFYAASIFGSTLLWILVFVLIIGGIKTIKSRKNIKNTYVSPFDKFK